MSDVKAITDFLRDNADLLLQSMKKTDAWSIRGRSRMTWMEPYIQETAAGTFLFNDGKVYIWENGKWVLTTGDDLIFDTPNRP